MRVCVLFLALCSLEQQFCSLAWGQSIERQLAFYDGLLQNVRLFDPIHSLLGASVDSILPSAINRCYDRQLNGVEVDIFQPNISTFQVLLNYYKSQPTKNVTLSSIKNLMDAARAITKHVLECSVNAKSYKLGFTSMSDKSAEEFQQFMTGYKEVEPSNEMLNATGRISSACYAPRSFRAPSRINWVDRGMVTGVRHQGQCSSCWAFAVAANLESAYLKTHRKRLDLSEQVLVDCAGPYNDSGECSAGTSYMAFRYIYYNGVGSEEEYPYGAAYYGCPSPLPKWVAALRGYCIRGLNRYGPYSGTVYERVTDAEMERAVAYFGPVSVCLNSDKLQHYKGGIFDEPNCPRKITHMVLLVGYTPTAWILKNSWGASWGERGYFQMAKGKNMCNINFEIAYALV